MSKVVCSCGWSWNKSDSSKKDMYVCHKCGNANAKDSMKNGGWLDAYNEEVPQAQNGIEGTMAGLTDKGFNYNGAWGGQFQMGGNLPGTNLNVFDNMMGGQNNSQYETYGKDAASDLNSFNPHYTRINDSNNNNIDYSRRPGPDAQPYYESNYGESDRGYMPWHNTQGMPLEMSFQEISNTPIFRYLQEDIKTNPFFKTRLEDNPYYGFNAPDKNINYNTSSNYSNSEPSIVDEKNISPSWNIKQRNTRLEGRGGTYDDVNTTTDDINVVEQAKRKADIFNKSIQEKYGDSPNPKAQERAKILRNDVEVTPNYKMGGDVFKAQEGMSMPGATGNMYARYNEGGEIPMAQNGRATRADSLAVYNNAKKVEDYYKSKNYKLEKENAFVSNNDPSRLKKILSDDESRFTNKQYNETSTGYDNIVYFPSKRKLIKNNKESFIDASNPKNKEILKKIYNKKIDDNKLIQREGANRILNLDSPSQYFDLRIQPQSMSSYKDVSKNTLTSNDKVDIIKYDPLAVKPFDLLTDAEKKLRVEKYGLSGVPKSYLDKIKPPDKQDKTDKQRPKVEALQPLTQQGVVSDFNVTAQLPVIRPKARMPKYYDVEDIVNNGRSQTNYQWYPENAEALRQLSEESGDRRTMVPRYQDGGSVNDEEVAMRGMMKSKIGMGNAFNHPAIKRMSQAVPKTGMTPEGEGTHYMSSMDNYAVPLLQDKGNNWLDYYENPTPSSEDIRFDRPEDAQYFAEHYKEVAPMSTIFKGLNNFQTGGSMPGSVGFTYARTKGIPSEGPYAKKTMPSAQNGMEMRYFQEGLDWRPKGMKDGGWLDGYSDDISKAQWGETLTPEQAELKKEVERNNRKLETKAKWDEYFEKERKKEEAKKWVQGSMEEAYKHPLMSPGYFTPEGVAIGALQGATKLGPDLYKGDYKAAAVDVLMGLPIAIPAAKTLGRVLGPEEGLMGKVSQELNINRNLSNIKKEGKLQGLSEHEIAKKQMEQVGITSNQRKGYTPVVSELAEKYVTPQGYIGNEGNSKISQIIQNIKQGGVDYKYIRPERLDAWRLYLGRPQLNKTFSLADTAPALHPSYKPGSLGGMDIYNINSKSVLDDIKPNADDFFYEKERLALLDNPISVSREPAIMGGYNKVMTKQGTQYNDIWDLDAPMSFRSLVPNKISENSLLENIFYKTNAQGVKSPRGVTVPVSKVFGKPFMSHGNLPYTSTEYVNALRNELSEKLTNIGKSIGPNEIRPVPIEKRFLQELKNLENYPKFKQGGIIKDDRGQWDHPGEITEISGNKMATHGYGNIPLYVVPDVGKPRMVYPNTGTHTFPGATKFTEYPKKARNGVNQQDENSLVKLDQLTNFTNYNTKQPGGWLDNL